MPRPKTVSDAALLAAAREVFFEEGYGAPVARIAARAGVSTATVFLRYPTKDALFFAVISSSLAERILPILPSLTQAPSQEAALRLLATRILSFFREFAPLILMSAGAGRERIGAVIPADSPIHEVHHGITAWFVGEMDAGRFRRTDAALVARIFAATLADYAMSEACGAQPPYHPTAEAYLDGVVDLTLHGLLPR